MPTNTAQGLQCVPISNEIPAFCRDETKAEATSFATEGEAELIPEETWDVEPSAYWQAKRQKGWHRHGRASDSSFSIDQYARSGPCNSPSEIEVMRTIDPHFTIEHFGHIDDRLNNLPDWIPKPAEYGMAPSITETYAASMTKQVCENEGLVSDHFVCALNRGKGPDVKECEDDPYQEGILNHYTETCESIWNIPEDKRTAWMKSYDLSLWREAKDLLKEITDRRNESILANGYTSQGCEGLDWQNTQWCENFKRII